MTSLGVSATLRSTACNDGLPRAAGPRGIPRCTRRASVHRSLPPRKPAQRGPTSTTVRVNAFWFWNKSEAEPTAGGASVTTAAPLPSAEAARNNVSPAGGRFGEKTASSLAAAEPVVDDWQRLTNVSYYPNATSKFQASRWHVQKRLGQGRCVPSIPHPARPTFTCYSLLLPINLRTRERLLRQPTGAYQ